MNDFSDSADFDWGLETEASDEEFEIDAGATSFYMPQGNIVTFKAVALNGTPPFTFTWNFGDDTPTGTGEMIKHQFHKLGHIDVSVVGKDASGATALMTLEVLIATPVDFAIRMQMDPAVIEDLKKRYPESAPSPALTP